VEGKGINVNGVDVVGAYKVIKYFLLIITVVRNCNVKLLSGQCQCRR